MSLKDAYLNQCCKYHLLVVNNDILPTKLEILWQDIATRYSEPTRAYHTLAHLRQLFSQFKEIKHELRQPSIVALALFYHDVIYDPKRSDNELKSAEYAAEILKPYLTTEQTERVYHLIMMTAKHQLNDVNSTDSYDQGFDSDAAYLLDMDLSILGAPWSQYEQYAKAVRQEYHHVTTAHYRVGRARVLEDLLDHPTLYLTDDYCQRLEAQARENIKREMALLAI